MKQDIIDYLTGKKILILGYGREGKSALDFVQQNLPNAEVAVADQNPIDSIDVPTIIGEDYLNAVKDFDIVIKSPGVIVKDYLNEEQKSKITSLTDLFLRFCKNTVIGITGTKGKSTTSSLIYHILQKNNKDSVLVGNIGKPCFGVIDELNPETIVVFEMSSHQLEFIQASPHIAILLNIYQEHLDHYVDAEGYYNAKKNIFRHQGKDDILIYGDIFQHASHEELDAYPMQKIDIYHDINIPREFIKTNLIGEHNYYDILAASAACEACGVAQDDILNAVASFNGLPHRLQYVGTFKNIKFYNDSIATAQEAVISAIKAIGDVDTVILGGMDRGLDYHILVNFIRGSKVRNVILLPNTIESFDRIFNEAPRSQILFPVENMEQAVKTAYEVTAENHTCLLSPAAASYGFYKNFEERGADFCNLVEKYSHFE